MSRSRCPLNLSRCAPSLSRIRAELVEGRTSVGVEVVGLGQPVAKLIIDLINTS
jgi:hypothetical protein